MTFYAPGVFVIPPISVPCVCDGCSDARIGAALSRSRTLRIASMIPPGRPPAAAGPKLALPEDDPALELRAALPGGGAADLATAAAAFLAAAACLGAAARRRVMDKRALRRRTVLDKADRLAAELRTLLAAQSLPHWRHMARIGRVLRRFLSETYAIDGRPDGGPGRRFAENARGRLPAALALEAGRVLGRVDDAVSAEVEDCPEMAAFLAEVRALLDRREV
jgi:hypothetical protein